MWWFWKFSFFWPFLWLFEKQKLSQYSIIPCLKYLLWFNIYWRNQKQILNGFQLCTKMVNFGSISNPIWASLGQFGPFHLTIIHQFKVLIMHRLLEKKLEKNIECFQWNIKKDRFFLAFGYVFVLINHGTKLFQDIQFSQSCARHYAT